MRESSRASVLGANGQLGFDVCHALREDGWAVTALTHDQVDIRDSAGLDRVLDAARPDLIVNTAAAHNLVDCERDPASAFGVNAIGTLHLVRAAERLEARLIHMSTDYVFDGTKRAPYIESDPPCPLNVYGTSKVGGELFVRAADQRHLVVRSSGLFGRMPCRAKGGDNFIRLMLRLGRERGRVRVVTDEVVSPTHTLDLARQIAILARADIGGVVHASSGGVCTWFEFATAIFELAGLDVEIEPVTAPAFASEVRRPSYSVLENHRLAQADLDTMPHWRVALEAYLGQLDGA